MVLWANLKLTLGAQLLDKPLVELDLGCSLPEALFGENGRPASTLIDLLPS